jgi:hypothetical protein
MPVNDGYGRLDAVFVKIMGHDIPDRIYSAAGKPWDCAGYIREQLAERLFEKMPPLFWEYEHQRTFSAYRPGSLMFIFFATSECSGSMMTR